MMANSALQHGANGFDKIGKLTAWHRVVRKYVDQIVVNASRRVGQAEHRQIEKYEKYKTTELSLHIGPAGLKLEIKRQPTVKKISEINQYSNPNEVTNESP